MWIRWGRRFKAPVVALLSIRRVPERGAPIRESAAEGFAPFERGDFVSLSDSAVLNGAMPLIDSQGGFIAELDHGEDEQFVADGPTLMRCPLHVKRQQDVLIRSWKQATARIA
ncbi:hypothetical protein [Burkholderia diffusa]|uniref:hypothetical protein n=1 Tax=Burkholderia diffusa TaxID=488732 RepID=UPI002ABE956E|nr:hypothetical protein [Burkholderia diffusa]